MNVSIFRRSRVVVVSQSNRTQIVISISSIVVECVVVVSSHRSRIAITAFVRRRYVRSNVMQLSPKQQPLASTFRLQRMPVHAPRNKFSNCRTPLHVHRLRNCCTAPPTDTLQQFYNLLYNKFTTNGQKLATS